MRKPVYDIREQQRCRSACSSVQSDQYRLVRCLDSIIPLVYMSEISSLYLAFVAVQAGFESTLVSDLKTGFLMPRLNYHPNNHKKKRPYGRAVSTPNLGSWGPTAVGEIRSKPKQCFIAQSPPCSPFHHPDMTEIMSKRTLYPKPAIHPDWEKSNHDMSQVMGKCVLCHMWTIKA